MHASRVQLNDIQALVFLEALLQLLFGKPLAQDHGLDELDLDPCRSGRRRVVADDVEDARGDILPAPFAFARALVAPGSLIVVRQA